MRTLQVATAFGKNFVNPDPKVIKRLILETAEKDWMTGSGDSVFSSRQDKIESRLILGGSNMSGLTLMFQDSLPPTATWHLTEGNHTGETFETTVGGNIFLCFKEFLVSKETIWKAVEYFLKSGEMLKELSWTKEYRSPEDF